MLAIRLTRTGRSGHAQYRIVVQDSRQSPTSGKLVAHLGNYNPHTKTVNVEKDQTELFLKNGAQPSERVAALLKEAGVKLPKWVAKPTKKQGKVRNPDKLAKGNEAPAPKVEETNEEAEAPAAEAPTTEEATPEETATESAEPEVAESVEESTTKE